MTATVAVDLGRSHCRVAVNVDGAEPVRATYPGGAGLGDVGGPRRVADAVEQAVARAGYEPAPGDEWRLGVAVPGASGTTGLAAGLARDLGDRWSHRPEQVLVVSDALAWHVGALDRSDGAVLAVGTGAVAVRLDRGEVDVVDGRGLLLGDAGSGAWIGLHALRAAARSPEGPGDSSRLRHAALARFGPRARWPGLLGHDGLAAELAAFAPEVLRLAGAGDDEADEVREAAVVALADTARTAAVPGHPIVLVGGAAADDGLRARLLALTTDLVWGDAAGDGCDGVRILLADTGTAMEDSLVRHRPARPATVPGGAALGGAALGGGVSSEVDGLPTEAARASTALESLSTIDLVATLVDAQAHVPAVVRSAAPGLAEAADLA
ncbi:MAG: BadF/BadG/BcrA/BcrD ATPase family protein, partial [Nocardioidaceae bacterium]